MINILSVISELNFGGGENRLLNLARSIDSKRFRLTVATLYSPPKGATNHCGTLGRQFAEAGVKVHEVGLSHPSDARGLRPIKLASTANTLATAVAKLRQLAIATGAHAVDAHLETALYTAVPAAVSAGIPAAVTLYSELDVWRFLDGRSYRRVFFPPLRRFNLRMCSAVFTDSKARAADLQQFIGEPAPAFHVVPNGVRLDAPSRPRNEVLRGFGIPEDTKATIIGQVAGLVPFKGAAVLLTAARRAVEAGHELYVLCVGDARVGPEYPLQLRRQAEQLGISDRVRIQGYPGNIADVWNVIDVHVHASSIDSLPNAIIEGMSLGKPAVVSSVGAIPEHVDHERTGLVVPPDDPAAVGEALLRILGDEAFAASLGQAAYRRYLERFTPEITTRAIEGCFESMIQAHRSRRAAAR
jgi:glycosyltransferase involved in cell wall biosynthesis